MMTPRNSAMVGAFFGSGLHYCDLEKVLEVWGNGHFELIFEISRYVQYCLDLAEAGGEATGDFPGVYDYEVSEEFGTWFGHWILQHNGDLPDDKTCCQWLFAKANDFFKQSESRSVADVAKALETVRFKQAEESRPRRAEQAIEANIERIRCFQQDGKGYASTSQLIMFGLALCRPELLKEAGYPSTDIKASWARLDDGQREAVIRWWKST